MVCVMKMPLATADKYAETIVAELHPLCNRIAVAGSIRRRCPQVGDIDIVVEVTPDQRRAVIQRCSESRPEFMASGPMNHRVRLANNVQLEIYFVEIPAPDLFQEDPSPWGTRLLCRTGSKQFNIWLAQQAISAGMHWNPYWGLFLGARNIASAEEVDIFKALHLSYIHPENRER